MFKNIINNIIVLQDKLFKVKFTLLQRKKERGIKYKDFSKVYVINQ